MLNLETETAVGYCTFDCSVGTLHAKDDIWQAIPIQSYVIRRTTITADLALLSDDVQTYYFPRRADGFWGFTDVINGVFVSFLFVRADTSESVVLTGTVEIRLPGTTRPRNVFVLVFPKQTDTKPRPKVGKKPRPGLKRQGTRKP
jgi:hypothetical protein